MSVGSPSPAEHHPYQVNSVREHDDLQPGGQFVKTLEVTFTGPSGSVASVNVPAEQATPAMVDQMIQAKLDTIEGIHGLGPEPHPENLAAPGA